MKFLERAGKTRMEKPTEEEDGFFWGGRSLATQRLVQSDVTVDGGVAAVLVINFPYRGMFLVFLKNNSWSATGRHPPAEWQFDFDNVFICGSLGLGGIITNTSCPRDRCS